MTRSSAEPHSADADASADPKFEHRLGLVSQAIDLHHTHLTDYLRGLTRNYHDAQDIAQELWRHVLLHFPEEKISQFGIIRHKAYQLFVDHHRRRRNRQNVPFDAVTEPATPAHARETIGTEEEEALRLRFWSEFPGIDLSDRQKECLWRYARYGYTIHEIAADLSIPKSTVADWIALSRRKIKEQLEA